MSSGTGAGPGTTSKSLSDFMLSLQRASLALERRFQVVLESLTPECPQEAERHTHLRSLHSRSVALSSELSQLCSDRHPTVVWLALVYTSPSYLAAYREFLTSSWAQTDLLEDRSSRALLHCCQRLGHLLRLASQQREFVYLSVSADRASSEALEFAGVRVSQSERPLVEVSVLEEVERALESLESLEGLARESESWLRAREMFRAVTQGGKGLPELTPEVRYRGGLECRQVVEAAGGTGWLEIPVRLCLFSNGVAVMAAASTNPTEGYRLSAWLPLPGAEMILFPATTSGPRKNAFCLCSQTERPGANARGSALPPGWGETDAKGVKRFLYRPTGATQAVPPVRFSLGDRTQQLPMADVVVTLLPVGQEGQRKEWSRLFAETGGRSFMWQSPQTQGAAPDAPYQIAGTDLVSLVAYESKLVGHQLRIPSVFSKLLRLLIRSCLSEEGLMRVSVEQSEIEGLKSQINGGKLVTEGELALACDANPHTAGSLLKALLRDLPEPLVGPELYAQFISVASILPASQVPQLRVLVALLPDPNRALLADLCRFLGLVAQNFHENQMSASSLAIVTSPSVLYNKRETSGKAEAQTRLISEIGMANNVTALLITNAHEIFPREPSELCWMQAKGTGHRSPVSVLVKVDIKNEVWSLDVDGNALRWAVPEGNYVGKTATKVLWPTAAVSVANFLWIGCGSGVSVFDVIDQSGDDFACLSHISTCAPVASLCHVFGDDDEVWVGTSRGTVEAYSVATLEKLKEWMSPAAPVSAMEVVATGEGPAASCVWSAGGTRTPSGKKSIQRWDVSSHALLRSIPAVESQVSAICHPTDSKAVFTGSLDGAVSAWDAETLALLSCETKHRGAVVDMAALADQVWCAGADGVISVWSASTLQCVQLITDNGYHKGEVTALLGVNPASDDRTVWSSSRDRTVCVWRARPLPSSLTVMPKP